MREILIKWLQQALLLHTGEELFIPSDTQDSRKELYNMLRKELVVMKGIDAEANKIRVYTTYKDGQFWVVLKKIAITSLVAFKKDVTGTVTRVSLTHNKEQEKIKKLEA